MRKTLLTFFILLIATSLFAATKERTLYNFAAGADGAVPVGSLVFDKNGNLFGVTNAGGNSGCNSLLSTGCGTVFELSPNGSGTWKEQVLYVFQQATDGGNAFEGAIMDGAGNLYGSTQYYGALSSGTVWQLAPQTDGTWSESVLHALNGSSDGFSCLGLSFDRQGHLFGTTFSGGQSFDGVAFALLPQSDGTWNEKVLHSFKGGANDGDAPSAAIHFDTQGHGFGTTYEGGPGLTGTVFEVQHGSSGFTETPIYFFQGLGFTMGPDGVNPVSGVVEDRAGNLYGTTYYGGSRNIGVVYELSPDGSGGWTEKVIYTFMDGADGGRPQGLILDPAGNLYGVTTGHNTLGSVFELSPSAGGTWRLTVLHDFSGPDGAAPSGTLVRDSKGNLYGTTQFGGTSGNGLVFEITP